jgi:RNA polymerase sigma-70 factor, ECF subfamily
LQEEKLENNKMEMKNNDEGFFEDIVKNYSHKLINGSYKMIADYDAAEDIVQETFLSFYLLRDRFENKSGIFTYLYRIMLNKSIDYIRKNRKKKNPSYEHEIDINENMDTKIVVNEALKRLPMKLRLPLTLVEYEHLQYDEVAEILKIPLNTVRTRIYKARKKLLEIFNKMGVTL